MKLTPTTKSNIDILLPASLGAVIFYMLYKQKKDYKEAGMVALIVAGISYVIISAATKSILNATTDSVSATKKAEIAQSYGANTADVAAATERARIIHVSFYGADGNAYTEDEATALATINQCNNADEVKLTCSLYQAAYSKSLAADFTNYTSSYNEWETPLKSFIKTAWF